MGQAISVNGRLLSFGAGAINLTCIDPADITISPTSFTNISNTGRTCSVSLCGHVYNKTTLAKVPNVSWITVSSPQYPAPAPGTTVNLEIAQNCDTARSATIQFIPNVGTTKCVSISQLAADPVYLSSINSYDSGYYSYCLSKLCGVCVPSTCTTICVYYDLYGDSMSGAEMCILCNSIQILGCSVYENSDSGDYSFTVKSTDNVCFCTNASIDGPYGYADASMYIGEITQVSGSYRLGDPYYQSSYVYG
jgi:hypothetical protein